MAAQQDWRSRAGSKGARAKGDEHFLQEIQEAILQVAKSLELGGITMVDAQRATDKLREMYDCEAFETALKKLEEDFENG